MDSSTTETLSQYRQQLIAVEKALKTSSDENKAELLDLKEKLTEVITLLDSNATKCEDSSSKQISETSDCDDEFLRFQREISQLDKEAVSNNQLQEDGLEEDETSNVHSELYKVLSSMEGNKCRAPFSRQWGQRGYHNAIIFSTDLDDDIEDIKDVSVKVMFCNPICDEMKPCPYFLDGHCKFDEENCRYSHGYSIKYSDLEDYILPNYSNVDRDSKCLVKYKDGLWYGAVVEKCLVKQQYCIKYNDSGNIATVDAHDLLPLDQLNLSSDDDGSNSDSSSERDEPINWDSQSNSVTPNEINYQVEMGTSAMGEWEQHTKGIGSKLMAKMGYVWGQGLGKNSDGRLEPVEAIVLPKGKSLDTCVEMRGFAGPETVEDRFKSEQLKQEKRVKKLEQSQSNSEGSVFEFMNKNLGGNNDRFIKTVELSKKRSSTEPTSNNKTQGTDLNFEMYAVGEDIKKTKKEIFKLRESLKRNADRNESACAQMKQKMVVQNSILKKLEAKEQKISNEINAKKNHKKISVF